MVPSFKKTASIFPEISFIQYFTIFGCKQYDVITDLVCIIEKRQYLKNEKQKIFFMSYALKAKKHLTDKYMTCFCANLATQ